MKVTVVGLSRRVASGAPHDEQKLAPGGLLWPHWLQKTSSATASPLDQRAVAVGVEQLAQLRGVGGLDDEHPPLAVRVVVEALGVVAQLAVDLDDRAGDGGVD